VAEQEGLVQGPNCPQQTAGFKDNFFHKELLLILKTPFVS
jgi:hypothetical protein